MHADQATLISSIHDAESSDENPSAPLDHTPNSQRPFPYVDSAAMDSPIHTPNVYGHGLSDFTPSRHNETMFMKRPYPQHPPYPYDRQYHNHNVMPELSGAHSSSDMKSLVQSQKDMMKSQEGIMNMLKKVSERVEELEKNMKSTSPDSNSDTKRIPPKLSVNCP